MTMEAAAPNPQPAKSVGAAPRPAAGKPKTHRSEKYPVAFHYSISIPMNESLQRLTSGPAGLLREVDIGRLALHSYLMANDPYYARAMGGQHGR
jgi:hypothetical protein